MDLSLEGKESCELGLIFLQEAQRNSYSIAPNLEAEDGAGLEADIEGKVVVFNFPFLEANLYVKQIRNSDGNANPRAQVDNVSVLRT